MKKKPHSQYEPICCNCARARAVMPMESYICRGKKLVPFDGTCGSYKLDPLKITRTPSPPLPEFEREDFSLD